MNEGFRDSRDHLTAEMDRLLALLRARCLERQAGAQGAASLVGLHVAPEEVAAILARPLNPLAPRHAADTARVAETAPEALLALWAASGEENQQRRAAARSAGTWLALDLLADAFQLQPFDEFVLLLALAPELEPAVGRLYAYLQGEATRTAPTVGLALTLLGMDAATTGAARSRFDVTAPLRRQRLLTVGSGLPLREQPFFLAERVLRTLLGQNEIDPALAAICDLQPAGGGDADSDAPSAFTEHPLARLAAAETAPLICYLQGPYGSGREALATGIAGALGLPLLKIDGLALRREQGRLDELLAQLRREALLQQAALYVRHGEELLLDEEPYAPLTRQLLESAVESSRLTFLAGTAPWVPRTYLNRFATVTWRMSSPDVPTRRRLWVAATSGAALAADVDLDELTGRFRFTPGQIVDTWRAAGHSARLRNPDRPTVSRADLFAAAHGQAVHHLHEMAQLIAPVHTWDDIILPPETTNQLQEISRRARNLHKVYNEWGFGRKLSTNRGIVALFSGPSGTGKTMAASIIARDLGLEMYRVDLSAVVSKYVGETEKNLSRIFDEAWRSNAIIFFDEADALFGKRSEVRDSHDRYANIEVNYLLQRIDSYDGIAILATNLGQNIDDAFQRRLQFTVVFPETDIPSRYRIWTSIWPAESPLAPDLDFQFLAQRFKFNGGNIRNIVLQAAFLAAADGDQVTMKHLVVAVMSEVRKSGKLINEHDFGPYAYLFQQEN